MSCLYCCGRLRQGVELAGVDARGHQEVARAFGGGGGQDRGGELEEAGFGHAPADRGDDGEPLHDVGVQGLAAQIQEAILQPHILRVVGLAENGDRQLLGRRQHLDLGGEELHLTRRQLGVDGALGPVAHAAVDADHPLRAHRLGDLESGAVGVGDHLREPVVVAQVDEQQAAVVAHAVHPTGQAAGNAHVALAQRPAGVGAVAMHRRRRGCATRRTTSLFLRLGHDLPPRGAECSG